MAESSQQPATHTNDTLPSSTHIQRLEDRRTEPSGIVDVRPFQSRFTRVPEWIVQRSAVLDGIVKRYSSQNNTSAEEADLVLVAPSQAVPRDETPTFETATQTTTPSSVPIARASRPELTIHRSSTPTKPSVTPSTAQHSPQQGESQRQSPLSVKNSPTAPTLQRTASPSSSSSSSSSPSSPPPSSGQFRVSRKAIPLPKIQASTPANSTLVSAKKDLGEGKSEDEDEASTITHSSIDASNHPPVAEEMTPIPQQSQNSEQSLVLPKRLSQSSTNNSENSSSSSHLEIENVSTDQNSIQTDISQPTVSQSTINQPALAREIATKPEISQISTQSLILPKSLQQFSPTADSTHVTFEGGIERSVKRSFSQENLTQQNLTPISRNNTQPQSSIIGKEILKFPPQQSEKSLILPKRLSQSTNDSEKSSESSQLKIGNIFDNQNSIQTDIFHPTVSQSTINQPALAREIPTKPEISQISTQSLILPKRLQQSSPTAGTTHVTLDGNIKRSVERSTIQENLTQQNLAPISRNNTQPQSSTIGKEILKFPPQQSTKSLILPKRLSQSTNDSEKSSESSQLKIGNIFDNQNSIQTDIFYPTVSQSTINQPALAREIPTKPEISQISTQSLILPKRLQQSSPTAGTTHVTLDGDIKRSVERSTIQENLTQQNLAPFSRNNTQPQSTIIGKEILKFPPQQSAKSLILPKRLSQIANNSEKSSGSSQLEIGNIFDNQNSIQPTVSQSTINQPALAREIATKPEISQAATQSLILPKHLNQINNNFENSGSSSQLGIESVSINQNFIKTDVSQPTINQPTLAREIAQKVDISQIPTQSLILPKRFQQETSPTSGRNHVTLQDGIERSSQQENSTQQNIAKVSTNNAQNQLPIVGEIASTLHELPQPELSLILPKRLSEASASNAESSARSRNLPTSTLQQKVGRESSLKASVVAPSAEPLRAIAQGAQALPIASEIPSTQNSLEQQNIVWRKSVSTASSENLLSHVNNRNHQTGMPLAINSVRGEPYIARQISTTSSPNSIATAEMNNPTHTTTGATPAQTHTQKHEINIAQIAEQVSRILHRNLSIERERRGMNLWY